MDLDALLLTDEAARLARVTDARIRRWAKSYPDLMPVRARDRGRPRYRAGDVLEVELATRKGARLKAEPFKPHPLPPTPRVRATMEQRFWANVKLTQDRSCWLWQGCVLTNGYGQFIRDGRREVAHRVAYELTYGAIPEGFEIDHMCVTRACVRPDHLWPVTARENGRLAALRRRCDSLAAAVLDEAVDLRAH